MLERLYEQRKVVTSYAAEHDIPTLVAYQWTLIENILRVLKPFFEMTEGASKEFEKISYVIPATSTLPVKETERWGGANSYGRIAEGCWKTTTVHIQKNC